MSDPKPEQDETQAPDAAVASDAQSLPESLAVPTRRQLLMGGAVAASAIAVVWNLIFNTLFERWESRQVRRGRSVGRRIAHAIGFEGGLVFTLVPLFAWWLEISLWQAFVLDLGLIVFFLVYTFVFNLLFDRIFGLPTSAQPAPQAG